MHSSRFAVRPSSAQQETPRSCRTRSRRGSGHLARRPRNKEQLSGLGHFAGGCLAVAPNSSFLLSSQVHSFILAKDSSLPYAPAYSEHSFSDYTTLQDSSVSLSLCPTAGSPTVLQSPGGCCWAALATTILSSYTQLLTEVRPGKAKLFLGHKGTTRPHLAQVLHPRPIQDIVLFLGIERSEPKRVKTSGNIGEMPFD